MPQSFLARRAIPTLRSFGPLACSLLLAAGVLAATFGAALLDAGATVPGNVQYSTAARLCIFALGAGLLALSVGAVWQIGRLATSRSEGLWHGTPGYLLREPHVSIVGAVATTVVALAVGADSVPGLWPSAYSGFGDGIGHVEVIVMIGGVMGTALILLACALACMFSLSNLPAFVRAARSSRPAALAMAPGVNAETGRAVAEDRFKLGERDGQQDSEQVADTANDGKDDGSAE